MNKAYNSPELELKSFGIKESVMAGELLSNPTWDDEWDEKTNNEGNN